ncbi:MAG: CDP-alcohol phosphatidyltransferase family protein [Candidatus Omnitrophica bacterium]|nr:CDP-alcohol phosphatidyltransferase family protein [Candidatus Omnitrophota bacterium]
MSDPAGRIIRRIAVYPGKLISRTGITPNQITVIGLFINCLVAFFIARGKLTYAQTGILIWGAGFVDALDGSVARASGKTSVLGGFLDSVLDRYADSVIYFGILLLFLNQGKTVFVLWTAVAGAGSLIVSYVRAKAESLEQTCEVGFMPRTVRIIVLGAGFFAGIPLPAIILIGLVSHLTVFQRIHHIHAKLRG